MSSIENTFCLTLPGHYLVVYIYVLNREYILSLTLPTTYYGSVRV